MASKTTAVATKQEESKAVAVAPGSSLSAELAGAYGTGPTGFEADRPDDYTIPFYTILQGISPQITSGLPGMIPGKIINASSNELFPEGINMVVTRKVVQYVEWVPNRGGFVDSFSPDHAVVSEAKARWQTENPGEDVRFAKLTSKAGNDLIETKYIYGVMCDGAKKPMGYGVIGFSSTKIKKYNSWNEQARAKLAQFGLPLHALVWSFTTVKERNSKGEFFNWSASLLGGAKDAATVHPANDAPLFEAVKMLMGRTDVKIDHAGERPQAEGDSEAAAM